MVRHQPRDLDSMECQTAGPTGAVPKAGAAQHGGAGGEGRHLGLPHLVADSRQGSADRPRHAESDPRNTGAGLGGVAGRKVLAAGSPAADQLPWRRRADGDLPHHSTVPAERIRLGLSTAGPPANGLGYRRFGSGPHGRLVFVLEWTFVSVSHLFTGSTW